MPGEGGQLIDPYRVAPAQGGIDDLLNFIRQRQQYGQAVENQHVAQDTRGYLNQQNGLPSGVDPMEIQKYVGEKQSQSISQGDFNNRQIDHQQLQDFAHKFMTGAQGNSQLQQSHDPYTQVLMQSGLSPYAAQGLAGAIGAQSGHAADLQGRIDMNNADNTAAAKRSQAEWDTRRLMASEEDKRKSDQEAALQAHQAAGIQKFIQSGGSDISGLDPRTLSGDVLSMALGARQKQLEAEKKAADVEAARRQHEQDLKDNPPQEYGDPGRSLLEQYYKPTYTPKTRNA